MSGRIISRSVRSSWPQATLLFIFSNKVTCGRGRTRGGQSSTFTYCAYSATRSLVHRWTPVVAGDKASGGSRDSGLAFRRMRATMRADLTAAIKSRDRVAMTALRSALAAIENAEAISSDQQSVTTEDGAQVAKAALGVGAAEAQRRQLTEAELKRLSRARWTNGPGRPPSTSGTVGPNTPPSFAARPTC